MEIKDILVVVDVQNDFVTGVLGSSDAEQVVPAIVKRVQQYKEANKDIFMTIDTHDEDYLNTQEGRFLPIAHCVSGTSGKALVPDLNNCIGEYPNVHKVYKEVYGSDLLVLDVAEHFGLKVFTEQQRDIAQYSVEIIGLDTDCCVMANAITLRTMLPCLDIWVNKDCCAGTTPEKHFMALMLMNQYQIRS